MQIDDKNSSDPLDHTRPIAQALQELSDHLRQDIEKVDEPRAQALFETAAEVLLGVRTAFVHYGEGKEKAWSSNT